jgi:surface protein
VNFTVDWGDGSATETSTSNTLAHTYAAGTHSLRITTSQAYRPFFDNQGDEDQITSAGIFYNVGTTLQGAFKGAANVTSITFSSTTVTANVTNMTNAFSECTSLTSLPVFDTSSVTVFLAAFQNMDALTAFPLLTTSSGTDFENAWSNCNNLVSISSLNFSSATKFNNAWNTCPALTTFPAGRFNSTGTLTSTAFAGAFTGCALTAQSIENILVSLDANGASSVTLDIGGGTNANASTWTTPAINAYNNLAGKGWNLSQNGTVPANSPVTGSVTISGTVSVGQVLTASNTLADPDGLGTITYQWNRGTSAISGATGATYTLVNADEGNTMSVTASFTDGNGIPESVTSSATIVVRSYEVTYTITNSGGAFVLEDGGTVNYIVDWGDGSAPETVTTNGKSHTYASSGNYTIGLDVQTASYQGGYWNKASRTQITSIEYKAPTKLRSSGYAAYLGCSNMTSFTAPAAAFSDLTRMDYMFQDCTSLSSISDGDTSSCSNFALTFRNCSSLVTAPNFDYSLTGGLYQTFQNCTSLTTFPANAFDSTGTLGSNAFTLAFSNCALTAQSIENILTSLDTNGASNSRIDINGGTNAGYSTWSTAAQTALTNLTNRGWTVYKNN